ncbi:hypothetical protein Q4595_10865 [Wenyingzhuangia sp. 1_MG-2023]|nr:hypothetical protein [Wenyingzhuangia sp. 1_MG-2023]
MKTIFVDELIENNLGGIIKDKRKAEFLFALHGTTFETILNQYPYDKEKIDGMFSSGRYVVYFNMKKDLSFFNIGLINYEIDLNSNFNAFADNTSPKSVAEHHRQREKIKLKTEEELNFFSLSDDELIFEKAYQSYKDYVSRQ